MVDQEWNSAFLRELTQDSGSASEQLRAAPDSQIARRAYVRSTFGMVEGITNYLKTLALRVGESNRDLFTAAETALLREESYAVNAKGEAYVQPRFIKIEDNLVFALRMYLRGTRHLSNLSETAMVGERLRMPSQLGIGLRTLVHSRISC